MPNIDIRIIPRRHLQPAGDRFTSLKQGQKKDSLSVLFNSLSLPHKTIPHKEICGEFLLARNDQHATYGVGSA
jgi:hypothetical protein